ncbi:MAG: polyphenol oxidase family protein [candidate division NC10 bacterium]|mgnify:CR=1 FL=1
MAPALTPHGEPPAYFTFPALAALGVPHATTTRHCPGVASFAEPISPASPVSPFRADAIRTLGAAGLDLSRVSFARQVHGARVGRAPAAGGFAGSVDILVTRERGVPLAIFTADCLAMILYDPEAEALGVAHTGWRGTVRGAAKAAVAALVNLGAQPGRIRAAIAPSIGPCCYEVDEPVISALEQAFPEFYGRWITPARPGHVMLDLWAANEDQLQGAGVASIHIDNPRVCTACHPDLFYSYRRGNRGRLTTVTALA